MDISVLIRLLFLLLLLQGLATLLKRLLRPPVTFPSSIPIVGVRKQFLSTARASLRQLTNGITTLLEGYRKVPRHPLFSHYPLSSLSSHPPTLQFLLTYSPSSSTIARGPQQALYSLRPFRTPRTSRASPIH